ncbi:MAG: prolipoprotein diacylglyceryl transferase [Phycisphaerae bacterium]
MRQIIVDFGTLHIGSWALPLRIYGYGLMLVLGFLLAIALAQWRARRAGENPDVVAHCGLLAVLGGILGARLAFVIQDWNKIDHGVNVGFSQHPGDILNVTSGGLIYYGGLILAALMVIAYLAAKRLPVRRYLDIVAMSLMVGLAFGRTGCLLNGCCYGGECSASSPIGIRFPMYSRPLLKLDHSPGPFSANTDAPSPVYAEEYDRGLVKPDPRLTYVASDPKLKDIYGPNVKRLLLAPRDLHAGLTNDQAGVMFGDKDAAKKLFDKLAAPVDYLTAATWSKGLAEHDEGFLRGSEIWQEALFYSQDGKTLTFDEAWQYLQDRRARLTAAVAKGGGQDEKAVASEVNKYLQADLYALAAAEYSLPVKASQAIGIADGLVLAVLLGLFYRLRRREGQVFAALMLLYPMTRFVEELIRADNKHSLLEGVLTHNQYTSMAVFAAGVVMLLVLRKFPASAGPTWAQRLAPAGASGSTSTERKPKKNHTARS